MEFRHRSGEERDLAYAEQALRAGFDVGSSGLCPQTLISRSAALLEELRKERMREELLLREATRKRMREEEMTRELSERRFVEALLFNDPLEDMLIHDICGDVEYDRSRREDRDGVGRVRRSREIREYDTWSPPMAPPRHDIGMDRDVEAFERPHVARKSKLLSKPENSSAKEDDHQTSGVKRKAASELPRKEWACSLCHVTATSQMNLNVHLEGKMHKANLAQLTINTATSKKSVASLKKKKPVAYSKKIDLGGSKQQQHEMSLNALWCSICKVECSSPAMLDFHLKGSKHCTRLQFKKGNGVGTDMVPAVEVVKEETDQASSTYCLTGEANM